MSVPLRPGVRQALRRILVVVAENGYATEDTLMAVTGAEYSDVRTALGILYGQRRIDRVIGYVVLPAPAKAPAALAGASGRAA